MTKLTVLSLSLLSAVSVQAQDYIPIVEKSVYLTKSNIQCMIHKDYKRKSYKDWCNAGASIDVRVNIAQMRSIRGVSSEGNPTQNIKAVRFSVEEARAGTGIHLVDKLEQKNTHRKSNPDRKTAIGPFASNYRVSVRTKQGYTPSKVKDYPSNVNTDFQHRETAGYEIGVNGSVGAEVDATGPKVGGEVGASFSYSQSKTLVYNTKEYSIANKSSGSDFVVDFERSFTACDELRSGSAFECAFVKPQWENGTVFSKSKFNPIAYSNFKPNFDVIYEAPVTEMGTTTFELYAGFTAKARFGDVDPRGLIWATYSPRGWSSRTHGAVVNFQVDWSHPLFEAEAHVTLQSLNNNNLCLDAYGVNGDKSVEGAKVSGYSCHDGWHQIWGLDTNGRYRSRAGNDLCLTVQSDLSLTNERCGVSLSQQWHWSGDNLISRHTDGSNTKYLLALDGGNSIVVKPESEATQADWQPRLQQIKLN
jgi:hemolysin